MAYDWNQLLTEEVSMPALRLRSGATKEVWLNRFPVGEVRVIRFGDESENAKAAEQVYAALHKAGYRIQRYRLDDGAIAVKNHGKRIKSKVTVEATVEATVEQTAELPANEQVAAV